MAVPYAEVIGDPIGQSRSPLIHNHWLRSRSIAGEYRATRVRAGETSDFLRSRASDPNWRGCNVTIPHKEEVLRDLDLVDEPALAIGAVNCVVSKHGKLVGSNTDVDGIATALDATALDGRKAAVIGAGGAARAALAYLVLRKASEVLLLVRDPEKARALEASFPIRIHVAHLDEAPSLIGGSAALINASPLGMRGYPAMPDGLLAAVSAARGATLFDMVYDPLDTPFLSVARGGAINGLTMLIGQAARAFELFFGERPPPPDSGLLDILTRDVARAAE